MNKIAFVFSGQGTQKAGMGRSFYENDVDVRALYDACEVIRPGTLNMSFEGSDDDLKNTANTQPCLYLADLAAAVALGNLGVKADAAAGFSLGEIPALAYAGAYSHVDGFRLAMRRGELMADAAAKNPASMAAVMKLSDEAVIDICGRIGGAWAVNFNCPGQVAVAHESDKLAELTAAVRESGGKVIPLKVSGGFHSPLMSEAAAAFGEYIAPLEIGTPKLTAYSNVTAAPHDENVKAMMAKQINSPVRWTEIVRGMAESGIDTFIEVGVGSTLKGLISKILPDAAVYAVSSIEEATEVSNVIKG